MRSLATANPDRYMKRHEAWDFVTRHFTLAPAERDLYKRLLLEGPIEGRYVAVATDDELRQQSQDELIGRFSREAVKLATAAAREALVQSDVTPEDVGGLVVNTCTGYLCPGISSYVLEGLGLSEDVQTQDLLGMGCGAALPNLHSAWSLLARRPSRPVLSVSVEICSATIFMGEDPGLVVSNSIFGDGAAACVLQETNGQTPRATATARIEGRLHPHASDQADRSPNTAPAVRLLDFQSGVFPRYRDNLRYRWEEGRLRNVLSPDVPGIGASAARDVIDRLLARLGMRRDDIHHWIVHPGGTEVLEHLQRRLGLRREQLQFSYDVFERYGNMSSPSVLFVLRQLLETAQTRPDQLGMLVAFGAGFSAHAVLISFG
jgi:alkylresorcinol/alkylpyrone synthase